MVNRLIQPPTERVPATEPLAPACTDGELLMRFRRHGDQRAFAQVVERHGPMIRGVCTRVLVRRADAEDAYQATLIILMKRAHTIRENDSAGGWLFRVAHNAALGALRRRKALRETPLENTPLEPEQAFPDLEQKQLVGALLEELRAMPTKYQTPLVLRYLEGQSRREIAVSMDATVATVAGLLVRGRRMLRTRLARRGVSLGLVLGALGAVSTSHAAGTIHALPPAFDPSLLAAGASASVTTLVNQGVRSMFYASVLKPAAIGAATTVAAAALMLAPPAGGADDQPGATLELGAELEEGGAQENGAGAAVRLPPQPSETDASRAPGSRPEVTGKVTATFKTVDSNGMEKAFASQKARYAKLAAEDASQDYEVASFEELYWQHQHWLYRQDMLVDKMKALDRQSRELAQAVSHGAVSRSEYEANQTRVLETRAEIPLAKAKIAEYERLMMQAALRETGPNTLGTPPALPPAAIPPRPPVATPPAPPAVAGPPRSLRSYPGADKPISVGEWVRVRVRDGDDSQTGFETAPMEIKEGGAINLPLVGAVGQVTGKTIVEATEAVREDLRDFMEDPQVEIIRAGGGALTSYVSQAGPPVRPTEVPAAILAPGDVVLVDSTFPKHLATPNERCLVEADGTIGLGAKIGRVKVSGLTMRQAEKAVQEHIDKDWEDVTVQLTPVEVKVPTYIPPGPYALPGQVAPPKLALPSGVQGVTIDARLKPGDVLLFHKDTNVKPYNETTRCVVEPSGSLALGPAFGRVQVAGLTLLEAEEAVKEHVAKDFDFAIQLTPETPIAPVAPTVPAKRETNQSLPTPPALPFSSKPLSPAQPIDLPPIPPQQAPRSGPIAAGERLWVEVLDPVLDKRLLNQYLTVDGEGDLTLGAKWGRVSVVGKSLREAEKAIQEAVSEVEDSLKTLGSENDPFGDSQPRPVVIGVQVTRSQPTPVMPVIEQPVKPRPSYGDGSRRGEFGGRGYGGDFGGGEFGGGYSKPKQPKPTTSKPPRRAGTTQNTKDQTQR